MSEPPPTIERGLIDRWQEQHWRNAISVLVDPQCTKDQFFRMVESLYPPGHERIMTDTFRGRVSLYDFRGIDLSGYDLKGVDFSGFDLSGSRLRGADISGACFADTQLQGSDLSGVHAESQANFHACSAKHVRFSNAFFRNGFFSAADLSYADLTGVTFEACDVTSAILAGTILAGATMIDCDVMGLQLPASERDAQWFLNSRLRGRQHIVWVR